jgi:hypothetical protein
MWKVTRDFTDNKNGVNVNVESSNFNESKWSDGRKHYEFRMYSDDKELYYEGLCDSNDDNKAFGPLDGYGAPNAGCTYIMYYNKGKWEVL